MRPGAESKTSDPAIMIQSAPSLPNLTDLSTFHPMKQVYPERSRRKGCSRFDARSVCFVRERERREERQVCEPEGGKTATPGLASRSGKARERRWRPFA